MIFIFFIFGKNVALLTVHVCRIMIFHWVMTATHPSLRWPNIQVLQFSFAFTLLLISGDVSNKLILGFTYVTHHSSTFSPFKKKLLSGNPGILNHANRRLFKMEPRLAIYRSVATIIQRSGCYGLWVNRAGFQPPWHSRRITTRWSGSLSLLSGYLEGVDQLLRERNVDPVWVWLRVSGWSEPSLSSCSATCPGPCLISPAVIGKKIITVGFIVIKTPCCYHMKL